MSTSDSDKQTDRVWFVTGASSGFGRAISQAVLSRGHRLVAATRRPGAVQELVDQHPDRAPPIALDVTDAALPHLRRQRSGHFVQMSSLNGVEGLAGGGYYAASKFAIEGLSESLADEVAPLGIRVTIVEPGPHRTRFASERSAPRAQPIPDYACSAGRTREVLSQLDGNQPGDPARAAAAILGAIESDDPPLRLPLGQMALDNIRARLDARLQELEAWAQVSAASDFPSDEAPGS